MMVTPRYAVGAAAYPCARKAKLALSLWRPPPTPKRGIRIHRGNALQRRFWLHLIPSAVSQRKHTSLAAERSPPKVYLERYKAPAAWRLK